MEDPRWPAALARPFPRDPERVEREDDISCSGFAGFAVFAQIVKKLPFFLHFLQKLQKQNFFFADFAPKTLQNFLFLHFADLLTFSSPKKQKKRERDVRLGVSLVVSLWLFVCEWVL